MKYRQNPAESSSRRRSQISLLRAPSAPKEGHKMGSEQRIQEPAPSGRALTRRGVFEFAGLAMLSTALPSCGPFAQPLFEQDQPLASSTTSQVMEKLSSYMSQAGTRPLPEEVLEKTK